ncbi:MAG: hypothetical protein IKE76_17530 [Clostridia bacterium]|nr:hypothetical protein [Clostridia bacterium]
MNRVSSHMNRMSHRHALSFGRVLYSPFVNPGTISRNICFGVASHELLSRSYAPDSFLQSILSAILMSTRTESYCGIIIPKSSGIRSLRFFAF